MIQVNELRIDNLVETTERDIKSVFKVIGIGEEFIDLECIDGSDPFKEVYGVELPSVLPIHLTEEWLIKSGASCDVVSGESVYYLTILDSKVIFVFADDEYYLVDSNGKMLISFGSEYSVHSLQNLYFCLTGKELELCKK